MEKQQAFFAEGSPADISTAVRVCMTAKRPAFIWGNPGIGKSDLVRQIAVDQELALLDIRASQWDAVDTRGIPMVQDSDGKPTTTWAVPDVFPRDPDAKVLMFLDELNSAAPAVQAALYQLILDRALGEYKLPDGVVIVAAGNLETDRGVTHRMATPLADRFFHFRLLVDNSSWEKWALENDIHVAVLSYQRWRPSHLHSWDAKSPSKSQATPRGWEYVSDVLKVIEAEGINGNVEQLLIAGKLGEAVGAEFIGFLRIYRNLQDPDVVLMDPEQAAIADDPAVNYALCGALAERASVNNVDRLVRYAERLGADRSAGPEFSTLLIRQAAIRHPEIQSTHGFIKWASDNSDVLIG
jgi:hypothetical protein